MKKQKEYPVTKPMFNPAHPGEVLKETVMKGLKLTVTDAAKMLDIDRTTMSRLLNGHIAVSVDMALRLSKALNTSAELWLGIQQSYDLAQARKKKTNLSRVKRFVSGDSHANL